MKVVGCLLRLLLAVALLPLVMAMPPLAFFFFMWIAWTAFFLERDK